MSEETNHENPQPQTNPPRPWLRFSLKTLLLAIALVAVYLGGRASTKLGHDDPTSGIWQMNFLAGHQRPVTLTALPGDLFHLSAGGVFNGDYEWKSGKLQVVTPDDKRCMGLTWQWVGNELVLTAEPPGRPAGPSYIGTRMHFVSSDISTIAQETVPVVPSMIPTVRQKPSSGVARLQDRQPAFKPSPWEDPAPGEWQITMPAGAKRAVTLKKLDDETYELTGAGALNGSYQARNGQLEVVKPIDSRMHGLAWARQNDDLVLVNESSPPPTGASYLGVRLRRLSAESDANVAEPAEH
jgi:hypothetical protein